MDDSRIVAGPTRDGPPGSRSPRVGAADRQLQPQSPLRARPTIAVTMLGHGARPAIRSKTTSARSRCASPSTRTVDDLRSNSPWTSVGHQLVLGRPRPIDATNTG